MIKILFIRSNKAFLPEVEAYIHYFNKTEGFKAYDSSKFEGEYMLEDFDVVWEFKGLGGLKIKEDQILIHEYASLSTGSFPKFKNLMKTTINPKPNLRIFLNENVRLGFGFKDSIEYCYRDMGIDENFLKLRSSKKDYDFVYVGSISREREVEKLLENFSKNKIGKICMVGNVDNEIFNKYKNNGNIIFTGKVPYSEVPKIASKAVYGINFMPDKYPFKLQTSTKLLEYLALDLKVITTNYSWVRQFERSHNCSFYKMNMNEFNININELEKYEFKNNLNVNDFLWDRIIEQSKIKKNILQLI
ncbi:glycosyltransferase [Halalkalibacter krulwichiae]|nr:glycosyltransferase [Halalkalibacter krulwichiae]